jgi:uncharacterized protein with FMN-binding domain
MKKTGILIATGTIGGMGAVFAVTPPQFGNNATGVDQMAAPAASQSPTATTPMPAATPAPSKGSSTPTPQATTPVAPTPAPTKAAGGKVTVTGNSYAASERGRNWGNVTVKVTFENGAITAITGMQSPLSRGQWAFDQLDPYVSGQKITIEQIKTKASSALPYVSGVSYTAMAYWDSLKSAINKAGL